MAASASFTLSSLFKMNSDKAPSACMTRSGSLARFGDTAERNAWRRQVLSGLCNAVSTEGPTDHGRLCNWPPDHDFCFTDQDKVMQALITKQLPSM